MQSVIDSSSIEEVLNFIVLNYGVEIYKDKQRLSNLIADLYTGEERLKRLYRRSIQEDAVTQQLYTISLKPIGERKSFYNRLVSQFAEANFYEEAFARKVVDGFVKGMRLKVIESLSTKATEEDGEWIDEYGVIYSADGRKLISVPEYLTTYHIKEGTVVICDSAFWGCEYLQTIIFPESITAIGNNAFLDCTNLQTITLSESIITVGEGVFIGCNRLTTIKVQDKNRSFKSVEGVLYSYDLKRLICYPCEKSEWSFVVPSGVTTIGNSAFEDCTNLQIITLPESVTKIGERAFLYCI